MGKTHDRRHTADRAEVAVLERELPKGLTPDMRSVAASLFACLREEGAAPEGAARIAARQVQRLSDDFGGFGVYVPKGLLVRLGVRDREIVSKFTGRNYRDLAREYGLTEVRVRTIISTAYAERMAKAQGKLF